MRAPVTPGDVEAYLHEHIPISHAMGIRVLRADTERVALERTARAQRQPPEHRLCVSPAEPSWDRFLGALRRRGQARIELEAVVTSEGSVVASFSGAYVAIAGQPEGHGTVPGIDG